MREIEKFTLSVREVNRGLSGGKAATPHVTIDALVNYFASLRGGHPRTLEIIIAAIKTLTDMADGRAVFPLASFVEGTTEAFIRRYNRAESMYLNAMKLCVCRPKLRRSAQVELNTGVSSSIDEVIASGALFECMMKGSTSSTFGLPPLVAYYVADAGGKEPFITAIMALMKTIKEGYGTLNFFESVIAHYIATWSAAEATIGDVLPSVVASGLRFSADAWHPFNELV
jgi:hypothetical protein